MPEVLSQRQISTRSGILNLVRDVLEGPDGRLFEAVPQEPHSFDWRSRFLVFVPNPRARERYLQRLKIIEKLTYYGWAVPDCLVHDRVVGLAAVFQVQQGVVLSEASVHQLGDVRDRMLLVARLCRVVSHGHDAEVFHGNISEPLVICNGGFPLLIDAPVGDPIRQPGGAPTSGRAAADIRAVGELVSRLTSDPALLDAGACEPGLSGELARIISAARADEPDARFVQIARMEDALRNAAERPRDLAPRLGSERAGWWARGAWRPVVAAAACLAIGTVGSLLLAGHRHSVEHAELRARAAEAEASMLEYRGEADRLTVMMDKLPRSRARTADLLRYSDKRGVVPDLLLAFSAVEQLRWPMGVEKSYLEDRLSFQEHRLILGRQFIDQAYSLSEERNLEVILTELMVSTWEFEAGEVAAAADTLRRVVPKLKAICPSDDPLAIGAAQLLDYTSQMAAGEDAQAHPAFEPWVQRIIDIAVSAHTNAAGPYGERFTTLAKRMDDEENYERDMEYTRMIRERMRSRGLLPESAP